MWCPSCRTEYREGVTRCADCGTDLVDELPAPPRRARDAHLPVTGPFSPDDDVVELMTTTAAEAEVTAAHLRSSGIPATAFTIGAYSGYGQAFQNAQGARVMVRRADLDLAASFVRELETPPPPTRRRATWVRVVALAVLLLTAVSFAASYPRFLPVVIVLGVVLVLVSQRGRPGQKTG